MQFYMEAIQDNAELQVRNLLKAVSKRFEGKDLSAVDHMDDGGPIQLKITIDADKEKPSSTSKAQARKYTAT